MYENFPSALQKNRARDRSVGAVSLGGVTVGQTDQVDPGADHIYQNPSRLQQQNTRYVVKGSQCARKNRNDKKNAQSIARLTLECLRAFK